MEPLVKDAVALFNEFKQQIDKMIG
jgi:hypothetical protein